MPADMQKLIQNKDSIIRVIETKGPSLPVQIARETGISLLFASAYLSELYNERKIKMSQMKVGSSSLYYMVGQEVQLENFIQYLNNKEREAFSRLKLQRILDDEKQEPAIRVALRAIKDFAIPIRIKSDNSSKLFWKHSSASDDEVREIAQKAVSKTESQPEIIAKDKQEKLIKKSEEKIDSQSIAELKVETQTKHKESDRIEELKQKIDQISKEMKMNEAPKNSHEKPKKQAKVKQVEESKFVKYIKEYLTSKDIEMLEIKVEQKKDFIAKVRLDALFGKQEYLLIAKDKKKISEEDLTVALHKAQLDKMPILFISSGEIDKKAADHAKLWRNLLKFERVRF